MVWLGEVGGDGAGASGTYHGGEFGFGGGFDAFGAAEVAEQGGAGALAHAGDGVEFGGDGGGRTAVAVVGDAEAVGFVA